MEITHRHGYFPPPDKSDKFINRLELLSNDGILFNQKVSIEGDTITIKHQIKYDASRIDFQRVDLIKE